MGGLWTGPTTETDMEAIAELIGALLMGFVMAIAALVEIALTLVFLVLEFLFVAATQGTASAAERYQERREQQRAKKNPDDESAAEPADASATVADSSGKARSSRGVRIREIRATPARDRQLALWIPVLVVTIVAGVAGGLYLKERAQQRKREQADQQLELFADQLVADFKDETTPEPEAGQLSERDAWNRPYELFIDRFTMTTLLVIRSAGADGETGTIDDLLAIRYAPVRVRDVGKDLMQRGADALKERLKKLMPGRDEELPADMDQKPDEKQDQS